MHFNSCKGHSWDIFIMKTLIVLSLVSNNFKSHTEVHRIQQDDFFLLSNSLALDPWKNSCFCTLFFSVQASFIFQTGMKVYQSPLASKCTSTPASRIEVLQPAFEAVLTSWGSRGQPISVAATCRALLLHSIRFGGEMFYFLDFSLLLWVT